jgi:predicted Zn-dependent protease
MKRWFVSIATLVLLATALAVSERKKVQAPVGPQAFLFFVADTQHELTRLPVSFTRISDADEINIGDTLAGEYQSLAGAGNEETRLIESYVQKVGARVAGRAHRKLPYKFHFIPDYDFINAFALPGGHVFIGAGLMDFMDSEDELAAVLGHEVEHIDHYHCAERAQTEAVLRKVPLGALIAIPAEVFEAGYSKDQELEADREGTRLAVRASYSPLGALRTFETFDRLFQERVTRSRTPEEELSHAAEQTLEGYFRSHPVPSERIAQVKSMIASEPNWAGLTTERPLGVAYIFWGARAERLLASKQYAESERAAARSLELHPAQPRVLAALAKAQFAQAKFAAARENYRKLVDESPSEAGAVAEFANTVAGEALGAERFNLAANFATASLDLQTNNPQALIILAEAQLSQLDSTSSAATYRKLKNLYPGEAENVITYTKSFASKARDAHHYKQAAGVASFWLTLEPGQTKALTIQAEAQLAVGNFLAAARALRKLLNLTPKDQYVDVNLVWSYADALSAAQSPESAAKEFRGFMVQPRGLSTSTLEAQIRIEWAGLMLMAGHRAPAEELTARARTGGPSGIAPELLVRLGWWYYRAAQYPAAEALLRSIAQERPGDVTLQNDLAWVELEENRSENARRRFSQSPASTQISSAQWNTPTMGMAVALWRSNEVEVALRDYDSAVQAEPRWLDERMVRAFYPPRVAQSVAEMQAEHTKRLEAKRRNP